MFQMKSIKRIFAVILAVIMTFGIFAVSASAAPTAPEFIMKVKSQTSSSVTIVFSLASGSFNSLDLDVKVSGPIGACDKIDYTDEFKTYKKDVLEANGGSVLVGANQSPVRISMASVNSIAKPISIFEFTFKKSSKNVTSSDFGATVTSCALTVGKTENVDFTKDVKVSTSYIILSEESIKANYKQTKKLDVDSSYTAKQIKWESSNTKVATVDENGNVKMTGPGSATITAKSTDGKASAQCKVSVSYAWWQWIIRIVLLGFLWY